MRTRCDHTFSRAEIDEALALLGMPGVGHELCPIEESPVHEFDGGRPWETALTIVADDLREAVAVEKRVASRSGHLLMMGGGEDHSASSSTIRTFVELASANAEPHIALVTTATRYPQDTYSKYSELFRLYGVPHVTALRPITPAEADDPSTVRVLQRATAVLFTGGNQSRIAALVGSKTNDVLKSRLRDDGLVVAGTSAGATAMGCTMIVGGGGYSITPEAVHTGPGLTLLPDALVDMHFTERGRFQRLLSAVALEPTHLGVGIDEDTAVLVKEGYFEVLGTGAVTVLDARAASVVCRPTERHRLAFADLRLHLLRAGCLFDLSQREVVTGF